MNKKAPKKKKRDYGNDYVSVTDVLNAIRKPGLEMWFKMHSKEECDALSKKAKEIGTQLHALIESYVKGEEGSVKTLYQDEVNTALKSFLKFRKEHPNIRLEWAELKISNCVLELNGTIDCIGEESGKRVLIDWKTGECKGKEKPEIYPEYLLQVGGYALLYDRCKDTKDIIDKAYIVVLAKDKEAYSLKEISKDMLTTSSDVFFCLLAYVTIKKDLEKMMKESCTK
ncbi:MAG: PD-(D/E)XK nuclease family protein [Endomicrobium sp.]|jgi:RecB family exonuclease|nr:PD-(D/E)XK nuclease family protein [Endomicrobium sp.]